jgi:glycerate kinase
LKEIAHIDKSKLLPSLKEIELITMCDIDNPLYGEKGAHMSLHRRREFSRGVKELDEGLRHLDQILRRT